LTVIEQRGHFWNIVESFRKQQTLGTLEKYLENNRNFQNMMEKRHENQ
jgi:hypothetical protein